MQHTIAALRLILPSAFTTLSAHASLAKPILVPHDTIHALVRTADGAHGTVELSWGAPVPSRVAHAHDSITLTGAEGWLEITRGPAYGIRVTTRTAVRDEDGHMVWDEEHKRWAEREEVVEERSCGVEREIQGFLRATESGVDDGLDAPRGTLVDVAFIEAALKSEGAPVDLGALGTA